MSNIFSNVETLSTPRSLQKMHFKQAGTYGFGKLYPCFAFDCVPSDTVRIDCASVIKAMPMVAPNMTPNKMTVHFWFVPYRLLDENFGNGVKGFDEDGKSYSYEFPLWENSNNADLVGTLWDYFGLPINTKEQNGVLVEDKTYCNGVEPTAYLKRAYNLIFNTMYRNQNTTEEVDLDSDDIQFRCWRADYFTKSLPLQQKPFDLDSVFGLPIMLTGRANISDMFWTVSDDSPNFPGKVANGNLTYFDPSTANYLVVDKKGDEYKYSFNPELTYAAIMSKGYPIVGYEDRKGVKSMTLSGVDFDPVSLTSFDQSDFRLWIQLQKWAERNNRVGAGRYDEYILGHFGVKPQDARLQLPEFLGGVKVDIAVQDDFASANSTVNGQNVPQGNRVGVGSAAMIDKIRPYHCQEFGVIIGIASILPQAEYSQGVSREWIKHDSLDFFRHEFCCLSDRAVYNGELCCSNGTYIDSNEQEQDLSSDEIVALNRGTFGYIGVYDEMRFKSNQIVGQMRTKYSYWHQARNFDATADSDKHTKVNLNANFVEARDVALRPFVLQSEDGSPADCFFVKHIFQVKAIRPCTARAIPGFADHF